MSAPDYKQRLNLAVNAYAEQRRRLSYVSGATQFSVGLDAKRDRAWADYGFPSVLTFHDYHNLWRRNSLAKGITRKITGKTWQDEPWIVEGDESDDAKDETRWESDLRKSLKALDVWQHFQEADMRRMVGRYAGVILRVADDRRWDQEIEAGAELVEVIPAWEGQLYPAQWRDDPRADDYGHPIMWQYDEAAVGGDRDGAPGRSVQIHPSRVVVLGCVRDGESELEAPYNDFISLEKVTGALGESYWKNAARQVHVGYDRDVNIESLAAAANVKVEDLHEALNGMFTDLNQGLDAGMVTFGASSVTPLVATVPPPMEPADVLRQNVCASMQIPMKVALGNITGERASTQDLEDFANTCQARRTGELMMDIRRFIDRLMAYRLIDPVPEYQVMWTDLAEAGSAEKLELSDKMATVNQKMQILGGPVFSHDEMRAVAGYEAMKFDDLPVDYGGDDAE